MRNSKKSLKSIMVLLIMAVMGMALLSGCGGTTKLADIFNESDVEQKAKSTIESMNAGDYDAVYNMFDDNMKSAISAEKLKDSVSPVLDKAGAFKEYKSSAVVGSKDSKTGEDYAVAVIVAKYENNNLTYTVTIDKDGLITGLYVK